MSAADERVDVVIPVYNAPELVRRCIDSLYEHAASHLGDVHVQDDRSDAATAQLLDSLVHPRLRVHHSPENTGYGEAVNRALARTRSRFVLVLNSDLEFSSDFVPPLVQALLADEHLAAVSPAGNELDGFELERYARRAGCVQSHNLFGYAFLVRREAFQQAGGFDRAYVRGFFEDNDLSRRLGEKGFWLGVHPGVRIHHRRHGSFDLVPEYAEVFARNRERYFARYPDASRQVLLVASERAFDDLSEELRREVDSALRRGGAVWWLHRGAPPALSALPLRSLRHGLFGALRMLWRRRRKGRREFTDLWIAAGAPRATAALLERSARRFALRVRHFAR